MVGHNTSTLDRFLTSSIQGEKAAGWRHRGYAQGSVAASWKCKSKQAAYIQQIG